MTGNRKRQIQEHVVARAAIALRIQHRDTGCWLVLEGNTPWWVSRKDIRHATVLRDPQHARDVARRLGLKQADYRITADDTH